MVFSNQQSAIGLLHKQNTPTYMQELPLIQQKKTIHPLILQSYILESSTLFYCTPGLSTLLHITLQLPKLLHCIQELSTLLYCMQELSTLLYCIQELSTLLYCIQELSTLLHCIPKLSTLLYCIPEWSHMNGKKTKHYGVFNVISITDY